MQREREKETEQYEYKSHRSFTTHGIKPFGRLEYDLEMTLFQVVMSSLGLQFFLFLVDREEGGLPK